ncbi:gfo/Idh/MocA family oxidoreductase (plasmid) [Deinococcus psychrotolerans]|uniref:Gfo/Idh/MocA family oxidoreductase n=1 Tax=Deinococcus psychrotolerans TaxID=2489213 RepID=A0A3G8YHS5_9DEIO|nr:Gfo/Idh/MocA family oxidoreductase [Deinococcus psychrotolerans]AZI44812.1 gfo/Idh/MocA family oxidoreductase [Deinococcus psychrotolerans]
MSGPATQPVTLLILGAGSRGRIYAEYTLGHSEEGIVVAVAEPDARRRADFAKLHNLPPERVFTDWREALKQPKLADVAVITTQDADHVAPVEAAAALGYHLLLEKPMAPDEEGCRRIIAAAEQHGVMLGVCHVLRYTAYTQALKAVLNAGTIGEIVSVEHLEPVGYWHQAHSFVRGHWRNTEQSSPMLLSKACHDLDWLRYVVGLPCQRVSSFGSLKHFRREEQPAGAADRCVDCPPEIENACPYSAKRYYLGQLEAGNTEWPLNVITSDITYEGVTAALRDGPYGRCVYACDNDVVDHQVVNFEFKGGVTASFTMTAFTRARGRETRIFGTKGELYGDSQKIEIYDFLTGETSVLDTDIASDGSILSGHGGGDDGLMAAFLTAIRRNDPGLILSGPQETLESHLMVFAAERARAGGMVVDMDPTVLSVAERRE